MSPWPKLEWWYYTLAKETVWSKETRQCLFHPEKPHQFIDLKLLQDIAEQKGLIRYKLVENKNLQFWEYQDKFLQIGQQELICSILFG